MSVTLPARIAFLLVCLAWSGALAAPLVIRNDNGGVIVEYLDRIAHLRETHRMVEITGDCWSACTLYTTLPRELVCARPGAKLHFHQAWELVENPKLPPFLWDRRRADETTRFMTSIYPWKVQDWIKQHGGLVADWTTMQGSALARIVRACAPL